MVRSRETIHCPFGTCDKSHDYEPALNLELDGTVGWVERITTNALNS